MLQEIPRAYPKTRGLALSALFAVLLSTFSLIALPVPGSPVPVTLQVFMVFIIVNLLGSYYGALACLLYLLLGAIGLPVFAGGTSGVATLIGPLGGFLFAFPLAAVCGGLISGKVSSSRSGEISRVVAACAISLVLIYLIGPLWLAEIGKLGIVKGYIAGAMPFIPFDIAKGVFAVPIALYFRRIRTGLPVQWNRSLQRKEVA